MVVRKRLRFEGPGLFFITTTVNNFAPVFENDDLAEMVLAQLAETSRVLGVSVVGYVLMPSHFHGLIGLKSIPKLASYVQAFKSLASRKVKSNCGIEILNILSEGGGFALWRRGFDDLLIHSEKQFRIKLEYIHNNPVKAGIVTRAVDYRYSSAADWLGEGSGLIEIDRNYAWTRSG